MTKERREDIKKQVKKEFCVSLLEIDYLINKYGDNISIIKEEIKKARSNDQVIDRFLNDDFKTDIDDKENSTKVR